MDMTSAVGPTDIISEEQLPIIYGSVKTQGLPAPVICSHTQTILRPHLNVKWEKDSELIPESI